MLVDSEVICMEKNIEIQGVCYELVKNYRDAFDLDIVNSRYTDYFSEFDYILGDFSYDKLRLKGFYDSKNSACKQINDIKNVDSYLHNYCAYGCRYFILHKKTKKVVENS